MLGHSFLQQNLECIVKRIDTVQSLTYLILPQKCQPFEGYLRATLVNTLVSKTLQEILCTKFWLHRGLTSPTANKYFYDGIKLNDLGQRAIYNSYQGAILSAMSQSN